MASTSNETKSTQVSFPSTIFNEYLSSREKTLYLYHPQWDLTNEEILSSSSLLKRDRTPICIPPSWDLVGRYVGPDDEKADGFDKNIYKEVKHLFAGDRSEAEFLNTMRNLEIGGILIGDICSKELLNMNFCINEDFVTYSPKLHEFLKSVGDVQIDFLHFHRNGIFHFEIKTTRREKDDEGQLERNRGILKKLFLTFCQMLGEENTAELWDNNYFRTSSIFYMNEPCKETCNATCGEESISSKIWGKEQLKEFWFEENNSCPSKNLFKHKIYRNFLLFLAGFRPDFFICPVKCALFMQKNIFSNRVNTVNYYREGDVEHKIQNSAKTVTEFLQGQKFVKNVEIDFGEYKNIYLTPEQQDAVGFFDDSGNFSPQRQIIVGPPGSGKSLILMLKIFILGQMEKRREKKVYYWSLSEEHAKKLSEFVSKNKSKFCREVKKLERGEWNRVASEGADVIVDEEWNGYFALGCLSSQYEDQIVAVVCTGRWGNVTSRNQRDGSYAIDVKKLESRGFLITELQTIFRSTRQIQSFFHKFHPYNNKGELISGHNFDGIKVEEWIFDGEGKLKKTLKERIQRLIQIEGCEGREVGLYQPPVGYEKPQVINNIFHNYHSIRSLEFPVMIVVEPRELVTYLCLSRAVCHLIVFTLRH